MKSTLFLFIALLVATTGFSFTDKNAEAEVRLQEKAAYYNTEYVVFEGYGICGLLFRNLLSGEQFRVAKKPDNMYVSTGKRYYITRQLFEYSNESCEMYEILTWSPAY